VENEWLEVSYINFDKAIMHGQIDNGVVEGFCQTIQIEQVLTPEQKQLVEDLMFKQEREMRSLLKSFVV
jgi:Spy/CpxP family protein refolding chaperone